MRKGLPVRVTKTNSVRASVNVRISGTSPECVSRSPPGAARMGLKVKVGTAGPRGFRGKVSNNKRLKNQTKNCFDINFVLFHQIFLSFQLHRQFSE